MWFQLRSVQMFDTGCAANIKEQHRITHPSYFLCFLVRFGMEKKTWWAVFHMGHFAVRIAPAMVLGHPFYAHAVTETRFRSAAGGADHTSPLLTKTALFGD